ncbi:hypothetical protein HOF18_00130 [archaeon]|nr:hypothetical protein [archaeon]
MNIKKLVSIITVIALVLNLILLGFRIINEIVFWAIIGLEALVSYIFKKQAEKQKKKL